MYRVDESYHNDIFGKDDVVILQFIGKINIHHYLAAEYQLIILMFLASCEKYIKLMYDYPHNDNVTLEINI